jgi:hypothetical protein
MKSLIALSVMLTVTFVSNAAEAQCFVNRGFVQQFVQQPVGFNQGVVYNQFGQQQFAQPVFVNRGFVNRGFVNRGFVQQPVFINRNRFAVQPVFVRRSLFSRSFGFGPSLSIVGRRGGIFLGF